MNDRKVNLTELRERAEQAIAHGEASLHETGSRVRHQPDDFAAAWIGDSVLRF